MKTDAEILMEYARTTIAAKLAREVFVNAFTDNCNKQREAERQDPSFEDNGFEFVLSATGNENAFQASLAEWNAHKATNQALGKAKRALIIRGKLLLKGGAK